MLLPSWVIVQGEAVAEVANIWNCKRTVAKTLLMHYMWDKEKLLSKCACWCCVMQHKVVLVSCVLRQCASSGRLPARSHSNTTADANSSTSPCVHVVC